MITNLPPDIAESFGYKCIWLAIRTDDLQGVVNALELKGCNPCNWATGLERAYDQRSGQAFLTPSINGFVLCVSNSIPEFPTGGRRDALTPLLERLASEYDEVQYFFTYRVSDGHAWAIYEKGAKVRSFGIFQGEVSWEFGPLTEVERELDLEYPGEGEVMRIAEAWSVNPTNIGEMKLQMTQGVIGRL